MNLFREVVRGGLNLRSGQEGGEVEGFRYGEDLGCENSGFVVIFRVEGISKRDRGEV